MRKQTDTTRDKRKREESGSPNTSTQKRVNTKNNPTSSTTKAIIKETIRPSMLNFVDRGRSVSLSEFSKN